VRSLSPEEAELWGRVTASIKPLSRETPAPPRNGEGNHPKPQAKDGGGPPPSRRSHGTPPPASASRLVSLPAPGRNTLDATWDRRLRSGAVEPDRVLDLHGMNLDSAWHAIDRALERSVNGGERVLLLITGHHRPGAPPVERGRIRAAVHDWLAASRHAPRIAAIRSAHRRYGGGGSLYIILRRSDRR
jgi:DNA-nicking Smr family endonuclease